MASGLVFDPARLLRLAPLLGTMGSLLQACTETNTMAAFADPQVNRKPANELLPKWFAVASTQVVSLVLGFNTLTTSTTITILLRERAAGRGLELLSSKLYLAGLVAAIGHLAFVPWVVGPMDTPVWNIMEDRNKEGAVAEVQRWLKLHRVRTLVADLPAFLFCLAAVLTVSPL